MQSSAVSELQEELKTLLSSYDGEPSIRLKIKQIQMDIRRLTVGQLEKVQQEPMEEGEQEQTNDKQIGEHDVSQNLRNRKFFVDLKGNRTSRRAF